MIRSIFNHDFLYIVIISSLMFSFCKWWCQIRTSNEVSQFAIYPMDLESRTLIWYLQVTHFDFFIGGQREIHQKLVQPQQVIAACTAYMKILRNIAMCWILGLCMPCLVANILEGKEEKNIDFYKLFCILFLKFQNLFYPWQSHGVLLLV